MSERHQNQSRYLAALYVTRTFFAAFGVGTALLLFLAVVSDVTDEAKIAALTVASGLAVALSIRDLRFGPGVLSRPGAAVRAGSPPGNRTVGQASFSTGLDAAARIRAENRRLSRSALITLLAAMGLGMVFIFLYSLQASTEADAVSIFGVGVIVAGAAVMVGGLLGFLFGVPYTTVQSDAQGERKVTYRPNTNLEQISDWLTKILVGVGLTQLVTAPESLGDLADYLAKALGGFSSSPAFGGAIVLYYLVCGFLFGFLWTRLFMGGILAGADQVFSDIEDIRKQQQQAIEQEEANIRAQDLARATMERSSRVLPYDSPDELNKAIAAASNITKLDIFDKARELRRRAWREQQPNAEKLARTLPVFRALALSGPDDIPHRAWGEIGFGLKDIRFAIRAEAVEPFRPEDRRPAPDAWKDRAEWQKACDALHEAIRLRDVYLREKDGPEVGHLYEANRAICRILLDDDYRADQVTQNQAARDAILKDLEYAVDEHHYWMFERDRRNPEWMIEHVITRKWMDLNEANLTPGLKEQLEAMRTAVPEPQDC